MPRFSLYSKQYKVWNKYNKGRVNAKSPIVNFFTARYRHVINQCKKHDVINNNNNNNNNDNDNDDDDINNHNNKTIVTIIN